MNCQEFWNTIPELAESEQDHLLSGHLLNGHLLDAHLLSGHLLECPACTSRMHRRRELHAGLRAVAASDRRCAAPDRVETRLLAAFRRQCGLPAPRSTQIGRAHV